MFGAGKGQVRGGRNTLLRGYIPSQTNYRFLAASVQKFMGLIR
jgi:hypothetical protein